MKRVTFNLPIIAENEFEPGSPKGHTDEVPVKLKQTKEFGSLPIIGKAQRSVYSYMLTMKMEQQLEKVQFSSNMYSKGSTSSVASIHGYDLSIGYYYPYVNMFCTASNNGLLKAID